MRWKQGSHGLWYPNKILTIESKRESFAYTDSRMVIPFMKSIEIEG